jgi:hypothetical protein
MEYSVKNILLSEKKSPKKELKKNQQNLPQLPKT